MPTNVLCFKVDFADGTGGHNVSVANYVHTLYGDVKTPPQQVDSRIRTTIYGRPCAIYVRTTGAAEPVFYSKGNGNADKGSLECYGYVEPYLDAQCVEFCNNVSDACLFHGEIPDDWGEDFEFRQPDGYEDISAFKVMHDWVVSTWQGGATDAVLNEEYVGIDNIVYTNDTAEYRLAKFKKEFAEHFNFDFCLVYYVTTFALLCVDQRSKNMFLNSWDQIHWEPWFYDNDKYYVSL